MTARSGRDLQWNVFPTYTGGATVLSGGYVYEFVPGHRLQNGWGFVAQHRLVAEATLGRQLERGEVVHHKDYCRTNNHPENLAVMPQLEHIRLHGRLSAERNLVPLSEAQVREAIHGRSVREAALILGCDGQTLRNRFPDLLKPWQRRSPTNQSDPETIRIVLEAAADPNMTLRDFAIETGIAAATAKKICAANHRPWKRKKAKYAPVRRWYRGKPTLTWRAAHGTDPGPAPQQRYRSYVTEPGPTAPSGPVVRE